MKFFSYKYFSVQLIALVLSLICVNLSAQFVPTPVTKSDQKILHQRKVYYIHTIEQGQTLYSICKAYDVTEQDIARANPGISLAILKPGQTLKIPQSSGGVQHQDQLYGKNQNEFIYHEVQQGQTLYFLHKKYNVPIETIIQYNPESSQGLQIGQMIRIPKSRPNIQQVIQPQKTDDENTYTVKQGDTLYSLAKQFGVNVADIVNANEELRWGLKAGQTIVIPNALFTYTDSSSIDLDSLQMLLPILSKYQCDSINRNTITRSVKVALLLPFETKRAFQLKELTQSSDSLAQVNKKEGAKLMTQNSIAFYEGFLLALDSLKQTGIDINLFTYDTESDTTKTKSILRELEFVLPDIIIGPVASENIQLVSAYSNSNQIPLILPLSRNEETVLENPYSYQVIPSALTEMSLSAEFLSQCDNCQIILLHSEDSVGFTQIAKFKDKLFKRLASKTTFYDSLFKEIRINDSLTYNLTKTLRKDIDNIVLLVSSREAYVSRTMGILNNMNDYQIRVFGLPVWRRFQNLRIQQLHNLNTIVYSPFYIDYASSQTMRFVERCRNELGYEPFQIAGVGVGFNYVYLGYEVGYYFVKSFQNYGKYCSSCSEYFDVPLMQATYRFRRLNASSGYFNNNISFINYTPELTEMKIDFKPSSELSNE